MRHFSASMRILIKFFHHKIERIYNEADSSKYLGERVSHYFSCQEVYVMGDLHVYLRDRAERTPDAEAVVSGDKRFTYQAFFSV